MKKVTEFNKANLSALREQINAALKGLGDDLGLEIHAGNCSFSGANCTFKLGCQIEGGDTKEMSALKQVLPMIEREFGGEITLDPVEWRGRQIRLVGYNSRARKMPFIYETVADGKMFKCGDDLAKARFVKKSAPALKSVS